MSGPSGFAVDVPITDLDHDEDNFSFLDDDETINENNNNNRNHSLDVSNLGSNNSSSFFYRGFEDFSSSIHPDSFGSKVKSFFTKLSPFNNNNSSAASHGDFIELFDRNRSASSFDEFEISDMDYDHDGLGLPRSRFSFLNNLKKNRSDNKRKRKTFRTHIIGILSLIIIVLIIVIIVVSTKKTKKSNNNNNTTTTTPIEGSKEETSDYEKINKIILNNGTHDFYKTTILISLDGFHPHYISSELTPFMHNLMLNSYGAPYMIPSFPSSTFPNHWSLVTGLYPAFHGIVSNTFFDDSINQTFVNVNPDLSLKEFWWGGEPLWKTATLQGVKSAIHMWPGSEVNLTIGNPMEVDKFNGTELLPIKVERLKTWLDKDLAERPELMLFYVPNIDSLGHGYGISGDELDKGLTEVDNFLSQVNKELTDRNLHEIVNLVIVSDHGMSPTSNDRLIYLDDLIDIESKIERIDGAPLYGLRFKDGISIYDAYDEIVEKASNHPLKSKFDVYLTEDIPPEFEFGGYIHNQYSTRMAPVWIFPKVGYVITTKDEMKRKNGDYTPKGVHGYDNKEVLMRAIFLAEGPYFENKLDNNYKINPFENIEIYNIVCDSLDLRHPPTNSSFDDSSVISMYNLLRSDWQDELDYPNVDFITKQEVLSFNATYDFLWRNKVNEDEEEEKLVDEGDSSDQDVENGEEDLADSEGEDKVPEQEEEEQEEQPEKPQEQQQEDHDDDEEEDDDDNRGKGKGWFGDLIDDVSDWVDDVVEDIGDTVENIGDSIVKDYKNGVKHYKDGKNND
ncbi:catalytic activity protein [[Candida] boidinii]|nr:catalytic activity protein [[Candida] boidinii]